MLQDEVPILSFLIAARLLMPVFFAGNSDSLCEVLWADDKVNPTRIYMGAVPDDGVQAHLE